MKTTFKKAHIITVVLMSLILSACSVLETPQMYIERLYSENQYQEILEHYNQNELSIEKDFETFYQVANAYHLTGEHEEALEVVDTLLDYSDMMKYRILKYNILESLGAFDVQEELVKETLEQYKEEYTLLNDEEKSNYCYWLILNYENEEAIEKYEQLLIDVSNDSMKDAIYNNLSWACLNIFDYEKAKEYSLESLKLNPQDSITLTNLGNSHYGLGEYENAREVFEEAMRSNPNNSYAIYGLATTLDALEDEEAIAYWEKYIELQPYDIDGWYSIYTYYLDLEVMDEAKKALEEMVSIDPTKSYYVKELLTLYSQSQESEKIENVLEQFRLNNEPLQYDLLLAEYTYTYVDEEEGYALYTDMLSNYSLEYYDLYLILENIYLMGTEQTREDFLEKIELTYGRTYRLDLETEFYYDYDEYEKLIISAKELIDIDSSNTYAYELMADGLYFLGDYENAYNGYRQALTLGEPSFYLKSSLADCAIYLEKLDEAQELLYELWSEDEEAGIIYVYKARIDMLRGDQASAKEMMDKALSISPYLEYAFDEYEELQILKKDYDLIALIH